MAARITPRRPYDAYLTPAWCVHRLLDNLQLPGGKWLEPCAGEGDIIRAVDGLRSDVEWHANELRTECQSKLDSIAHTVTFGDFLSRQFTERYDVIFTNPPYCHAERFVERSLQLADTVVMLLRVNFLASKQRSPFLRRTPPDFYGLPDRPSFTGRGTDSTDYAWFVWSQPRQRTHGAIYFLRTTPHSVRRP